MNLKQIGLGGMVTAGLFLGAAGSVFAAPSISQTWVSGTVYDSSHVLITSGSVTVHCAAAVQVVPINGVGTYGAIFQQSECKVGDVASATANTSEGSGSNSAVVENTVVNGPTVDLDIAVIDITVPEFGMIGGVLTALGAGGAYMYARAKQFV